MATVSKTRNEVNCKIVYCGPAASGKTTSLRYVHDQLKPDTRGLLITPATENGRTLFVDLLVVNMGPVDGVNTRLHLMTVPGQTESAESRRRALHGADGIIFVADSDPLRLDDNRRSMSGLLDQLCELQRESVPVVLQYNKRDLVDAVEGAVLDEALNSRGVPTFETVATQGTGVIDALVAVSRGVLASLA